MSNIFKKENMFQFKPFNEEDLAYILTLQENSETYRLSSCKNFSSLSQPQIGYIIYRQSQKIGYIHYFIAQATQKIAGLYFIIDPLQNEKILLSILDQFIYQFLNNSFNYVLFDPENDQINLIKCIEEFGFKHHSSVDNFKIYLYKINH